MALDLCLILYFCSKYKAKESRKQRSLPKKEGKKEICHGLLRCQSVKHKSEVIHNRDKNAVQNMLKNLDPKDVQIVQTTSTPNATVKPTSQPTGQPQNQPMQNAEAVEEDGKWIQKAIKKPGALRKELGAKKGEPIPAKKLAAAAKKPGKIGQRARLAETLKGMKK